MIVSILILLWTMTLLSGLEQLREEEEARETLEHSDVPDMYCEQELS
jgi:hypothetical protein